MCRETARHEWVRWIAFCFTLYGIPHVERNGHDFCHGCGVLVSDALYQIICRCWRWTVCMRLRLGDQLAFHNAFYSSFPGDVKCDLYAFVLAIDARFALLCVAFVPAFGSSLICFLPLCTPLSFWFIDCGSNFARRVELRIGTLMIGIEHHCPAQVELYVARLAHFVCLRFSHLRRSATGRHVAQRTYFVCHGGLLTM